MVTITMMNSSHRVQNHFAKQELNTLAHTINNNNNNLFYIAPQQQLFEVLTLYRSTNAIKHTSVCYLN